MQRIGVACFGAALVWFLLMASAPSVFPFGNGPGWLFGVGVLFAWFGSPGSEEIWPNDGSDTDWPTSGSASDVDLSGNDDD